MAKRKCVFYALVLSVVIELFCVRSITHVKIVKTENFSSIDTTSNTAAPYDTHEKNSPSFSTGVERYDTFKARAVPQWLHQKFILLEKSKEFQKYGYELYAADTSLEIIKNNNYFLGDGSNYRLAYTPFHGSQLTVIAVDTMYDGEFRVVFQTDTLQITLFGYPKNGSIEAIACVDDFENALKRWNTKTLYSKRRSIDLYDSATGMFSSMKVSITEPLKVIGIRWGIMPLPPQPLWLIVVASDNITGIIPVHYSWTNVPESQRHEGLPWENDIIEQNPRELYHWDDYVWEMVDKHALFLGMSCEQVQLSWGKPHKKVSSSENDTTETVTWHYPSNLLTFVNDSLARVVER